MKKIIAIFIAIIYAWFVSCTLVSISGGDAFSYEKAIEGNNAEKYEAEPGKEAEAPRNLRFLKNQPATISAIAGKSFFLRPKSINAHTRIFPNNFLAHSSPLFIRIGVLRI